jgi:hypothetical protein
MTLRYEDRLAIQEISQPAISSKGKAPWAGPPRAALRRAVFRLVATPSSRLAIRDRVNGSDGMAEAKDYTSDVKKYAKTVDEAAVKGIVRYCGISLRNRDSSLVSGGDPKEVARVRDLNHPLIPLE